jgi:hypothetical protein
MLFFDFFEARGGSSNRFFLLVVDEEEVEDAREQDVASYQVAVTMQLLEVEQVVVSPKISGSNSAASCGVIGNGRGGNPWSSRSWFLHSSTILH